MDKKVSIIIPIYNVEEYLKQCIESIMMQTYTNLEIILVDDGSPDNCGSICDDYEKIDERIKVIHKRNGGLSSARNAGLEISTGEFITFVDSDDWVSNNYIENLLTRLISDKSDISCCGRVIYTDETTIDIVTSKENELLDARTTISKMVFDKEVGISAWGKLYKKHLFEDIIFPIGEIHEDVAIMYQLIKKCNSISVLSDAFYYYRNNPDGISKQKYTNKYDVVLKHDLKNEEFIDKHYPELSDLLKAATAKSCFDMILKIAKTDDGVRNFDEILQRYIINFRKRKEYFFNFYRLNFKNKIWVGLILLGNFRLLNFVGHLKT